MPAKTQRRVRNRSRPWGAPTSVSRQNLNLIGDEHPSLDTRPPVRYSAKLRPLEWKTAAMPAPLLLTLTDYQSPRLWRWVLHDSAGRFLADHPVRLDPDSREYQGFVDLSTYLDYFRETCPPAKQLQDLGRWIGAQVFGGLLKTLEQRKIQPALAIHAAVPEAAQDLLFRPFELACFGNGTSFREVGIRFIYQRETDTPMAGKAEASKSLRILAVFSLPVRQNPLNLRRERYQMQKLVHELTRSQGLAVELRVLQYGATREMLEDALQDGEGWDIVHLSGHGGKGELLLEDDQGGTDTIGADELGELLGPAKERLKLLLIDACYSGAGSHAAARAQLGLDKAPVRETGAEGEALAETTPTVLPSLAQSLAEQLDCAALAMRYPVGDAFATDLMLALYGKLLDKGRPLPAALQLALKDALASNCPKPPLSAATPILIGGRAAELALKPPARTPSFVLPKTGLGIAFPEEPPRFVGRLQPMLRASQALATRSSECGVLFHGMPGAGKTACALELAYRHAERRFQAHVWYQAPQAGSDIATALFNLMLAIQTQLDAPGLGLTTALDDPAQFRAYTLPRLCALLQDYALLLVLDNLETLLTDSGGWRHGLWGEVLAALLGHHGPSRLVLTSRVVPAGLADHPKLHCEPIHALSFAESALLARELPNLARLFDDEPGLALLRQTLRAVQGHPEMLKLADGLAADRAKLARRVAAAEQELDANGEALDAFFAPGGPQEGESRLGEAAFLRGLHDWTAVAAAGLKPTARLLFAVLSAVEAEDRRRDVIEANWREILLRLGNPYAAESPGSAGVPPALADAVQRGSRRVAGETPALQAQAALAEPGYGLGPALQALARCGLLGVEPPPELDARQQAALQARLLKDSVPISLPQALDLIREQNTVYTLHPGVAEAARAGAAPDVLAAAEIEWGDYHIARHRRGLETEMQGGGGLVVESARRAAPYLLRRQRWEEASRLLEQMLMRDESPEAVEFALPLLRRIADSTVGTGQELSCAGILAWTLMLAGRGAEAEPLLREVIARAAACGQHRTAGGLAGELLRLLLTTGRLDEALALAGEMAGYTRDAGLGPWTQLLDETRCLQILDAMGHYEEVLAAVETLRPKLETLPEQSAAEESANPWNVRETLLDTGRSAAMNSEKHEQALALNAEIVKLQAQRGASPLELAQIRFNDYFPLLRLERHADARRLLRDCRAVFEAERSVEMLGMVYGALADLEDKTGDPTTATRFGEIALGYHYQTGSPEDCAGSHHNLSIHLENQNADPALVLAQRLAAALLWFQMQSGHLATVLRNLAMDDKPDSPPDFEAIAAAVERTPGVRFRALFERLPRTVPDGDAALARIWQLVEEIKNRRPARDAKRP